MDLTSKTVGVLLEGAPLTASTNGPAINLAGLEGNVEIIGRVSAPTGTAPTLSLQLQNSADGSTNWQNVGSPLAALTTAAQTLSANLNPFGCLQYVRVIATVGGTTPAYLVFIFYIGTPQYH